MIGWQPESLKLLRITPSILITVINNNNNNKNKNKIFSLRTLKKNIENIIHNKRKM